MARGATNEANMLNGLGSSQLTQANTLQNAVIPTYESMLTEGYTPAEENAMTSAGMGAIGSSYGSSSADAARAAARTNNGSSLSALEDELAQNKGTAMGSEAANLQTGFANQQQKNQELGAQGLSGLFGEDLSSAGNMYGLGTKMYRPSGGNMPSLSFGVGPTGPSFGIKA